MPRARHYRTGEPLDLTVSDGTVTHVAPAADAAGLPLIAPAFFDPQINGCLGVGFTSDALTADGIRTVEDECRRHGIGGFCPTVITAGFDTLRHAFRTLAATADLARVMPTFHLEGPYISGDDGPRGAHPKDHARDPDIDEFRRLQDAADGRIGMVTLAPERPGALAFIEHLAATGVVPAIGHTAATGDQLRDAVSAGARVSTHLGNGCAATLPRHANPIWEQLGCDALWASVIADGHHLSDAVLRSVVRGKGLDRLLLTCDAAPLAGLPPGVYREWDQAFEVRPDGSIRVPGTPYLAGSGRFTDECVANLVRVAEVRLADAIDAAAVRPRELLGLPVPAVGVGARWDDLIRFTFDGRQLQFG